MARPQLETIYEQVPKGICPAGCGECCGPVFPSLAELRNIKDWCMLHHLEYKDFLNIHADGDCPYLTPARRCAVYPVRPFLCRLLGVAIPLPCPLGRCKPSRMLNQPQTDALYKAIYLRGKEKSRTEKHRKLLHPILSIARELPE